ncbi:MAG: hypothetical protein PHX02_02730 [Oscillospiraceae bacterium]|jgi:uncharacterized protein YdeI (YjbR/CyaY-like superfamily)|nr:hypothetical protein [Oscillospiraceae bacterium]
MDNKNNLVNGPGIPMGLGMALAQNTKAMQYFASLSAQEQQAIIENTHNIRSKQEMQSFVNGLIR